MNEIKLMQEAEITGLASPLRQRLLAALKSPNSASALARTLGMSRQRIGYHMRALEQLGLIQGVGKRTVRGCTEKFFRGRALAYVLPPAENADDSTALAKVEDRYSWAALLALIARTLTDLARLRRRADKSGKRLATLSLQADIRFATPADRKAFSQELVEAIGRTIAKHHNHNPGGRTFRLILGAYPKPSQSGQNL